MQATAEFAQLVEAPAEEWPLDRLALLVAAHACPDLDVGREIGRLDTLAQRCRVPTLDGLVELLWRTERFRGNDVDYYDPRNSYLNVVLDRHLGIPISLAIVALSVGRRIGVPCAPVSLPGHFLLRDRVDPSVFVDPFTGRLLDESGCAALFDAVHRGRVPFDPAMLAPSSNEAVAARLVQNLRVVFGARNDRDGLRWALRLRTMLPGATVGDRCELAALLADAGRIDEARGVLAAVGPVGGAEADEVARVTLAVVARLN